MDTQNVLKEAINKLTRLDENQKTLLEEDIAKALEELHQKVIFIVDKYNVSLLFDLDMQLNEKSALLEADVV